MNTQERDAMQQALTALEVASSTEHFGYREALWCKSAAESLRDALEAGAEPAQPVARVLSWTNGSYSRNYKVEWLQNVPEGAKLYTAPQPSPERSVLNALLARWEVSAMQALPADAMLINRHIRELREAM